MSNQWIQLSTLARIDLAGVQSVIHSQQGFWVLTKTGRPLTGIFCLSTYIFKQRKRQLTTMNKGLCACLFLVLTPVTPLPRLSCLLVNTSPLVSLSNPVPCINKPIQYVRPWADYRPCPPPGGIFETIIFLYKKMIAQFCWGFKELWAFKIRYHLFFFSVRCRLLYI